MNDMEDTVKENRTKAHRILEKAIEEAGIVDFFYTGVLIDGIDVTAVRVGREESVEYSNLSRHQRLLGLIEQGKYDCMLNPPENENGED